MCSSPKIPPPPPPPQEAKSPDALNNRRAQQRRPTGMGAGSILTSPAGIATSGLNLGGSTLLGG